MKLGKRVDRFVLLTLLSGALYLFFMSALHSIPLAAASAFAALALLKKLKPRIPESPRARRREAHRAAEKELEQLALDDPEDAERRVRQIVERAYPHELAEVPMELLLRHPAGRPVSTDELIGFWKRHRGADKLLVIALPAADNCTQETVSRLSGPQIRLLDGKQLTALIMRQPPKPPQTVAAEKTHTARRLFQAACRARTGKCALSGGGLCLLFFVTGVPTHLVSGLLLLLIACFSLGNARAPKRLFS